MFVDCDRSSWNMAPELLDEELKCCANMGNLPKAVIGAFSSGNEDVPDDTVAYGVPAKIIRNAPVKETHS